MKNLLIFLLIATDMVAGSGQASNPVQNILIKENVTLKGKAANAKLGAIIQSDTIVCYIDNLASWPDAQRNKKITVTGDLYKMPAPAFIMQQDSLQAGGIPVNDNVDYEQKKFLWLLKNVTYK